MIISVIADLIESLSSSKAVLSASIPYTPLLVDTVILTLLADKVTVADEDSIALWIIFLVCVLLCVFCSGSISSKLIAVKDIILLTWDWLLLALIILVAPTSIPISSSVLPGSNLSARAELELNLVKIASAICCFLVLSLPLKYSFNLANTSSSKVLSAPAVDFNSIFIVIFKDPL